MSVGNHEWYFTAEDERFFVDRNITVEHYKYKIKDRKTDIFDLVLSGHYHGGQWRIGNVGVYVPRIGLMIPKVKGKFGKHIISAGVSNTTWFSRLGNPRELVMIKI